MPLLPSMLFFKISQKILIFLFIRDSDKFRGKGRLSFRDNYSPGSPLMKLYPLKVGTKKLNPDPYTLSCVYLTRCTTTWPQYFPCY